MYVYAFVLIYVMHNADKDVSVDERPPWFVLGKQRLQVCRQKTNLSEPVAYPELRILLVEILF